MCDVLVTKDGIELWSTGDARRYGLALPSSAFSGADGERNCLCGVDFEDVLAGHASTWKRGGGLSGFGGWSEVGPDGQTWWEGYDVCVEHDGYDAIFRSDGRAASSLEEWESGHAEVGEVSR